MTSFEIIQFIKKFEEGTLQQNEWHHREHVLMAMWYLDREDEFSAIVKIKGGILKYNLIYQVPQATGRGYHETITIFFIKLVQKFILQTANKSWDDRVRTLSELFPDHMVTLKQHYKSETLKSSRARIEWIEPDLKPIEFGIGRVSGRGAEAET